MSYKPHPKLEARLVGYDPVVELALDHFARFVDEVVDKYAAVPEREPGAGQPPYDPRPLLKVLLYAYATGVFSSRRMEQNCYESLPYMLLVRDDRPSYRTFATARVEMGEELVWLLYCMVEVALDSGVKFLGKIAVDSTKYKADVSKESVVKKDLYKEVREKLETILEEAKKVDEVEDAEGQAVRTETGVESGSLKMRDVLRKVRGSAEDLTDIRLSKGMVGRVESAVKILEKAEKEGLSHVSLTDPDARMMGIGSSKRIQMGHSLEVAAENGLLLHAEVIHQSSDTGRLPEVVDSVLQNSEAGVLQVKADSGYFKGQDVLDLEEAGVEVIVPDANVACDLKRGNPVGTSSGQVGQKIEFTKLEDVDAYRCPQGNILKRLGQESVDGRSKYRASGSCAGCPLAQACLKQKGAKHRTITVFAHGERLREYLARFDDPEVRQAYHMRGPAVETVFAGTTRIQGFDHWHVRGDDRVEAEGMLLSASYQFRTVYKMRRMNRQAA